MSDTGSGRRWPPLAPGARATMPERQSTAAGWRRRANTTPSTEHAVPDDDVWFAASCGDGDAHYGRLGKNYQVRAKGCGLVFAPQYVALVGAGIAWWRAPVDLTHGCPACVQVWQKEKPKRETSEDTG